MESKKPSEVMEQDVPGMYRYSGMYRQGLKLGLREGWMQ